MTESFSESIVVKQERELQEGLPLLGSPETRQVDVDSVGLLLPVKFESVTKETEYSIKQKFEIELAPTELCKSGMITAPHVNDKKKDCQKRYRKQHREKLKQHEVKRRKLKQNLQIIAKPSTSSNIHRVELKNEKITDANSQCLAGIKGTQISNKEKEQVYKHVKEEVTQPDVPVYQSSKSESEVEMQVTKKQRRERNWVVLKQFTNAEEAEIFIKTENTWSRNYTRNCEDGIKKYYRCNRVKKRGPQCDSELYLLYVNDGDNVIAYLSDLEHNHDIIGTRDNYGIHEKTKTEINKLFDLHLKPKAILTALNKMEGVKLPTKKQLDNYLSDRRSAVFGKPAIYLGELEQWIYNHTAIPEDVNKVFVISNHIIEGNQPNFRFALSTKRLLEMICFTEIIHADATHKLTWQGFPVLIVGTTDKNGKFHPLCLGVTSNEHQEDFQVIFQGLKEKVLLIYNHIMRPRVLICDAAHSIKNAFSIVFGAEPTIRMCWTHAKKNIQKEVKQTVTKNDHKNVLRDVDALHNATSPEVFNAAAQVFLEKWKNETRFVNYIEEKWLKMNPNWFLGAAYLSPTTNNALESLNRSIKNHNTLRERLPLSRFLTLATDMVVQWSLQTPSLSESKTIELQEWAEAYSWAKKNVKINIISSDSTNKIYLIWNEKAEASGNYNHPWKTFDEYKKQTESFHKTILPNSNWQKGSCDCLQFFKTYICKHILGLAIRFKHTTPPLEAKLIPTGQKRKRGRPAKSKPALILQ